MDSQFAYQNDLTRSGEEMNQLIAGRAERLKAIQAPDLLKKAKALTKRGQDIQKSAQDLQSAIEMGVGAPAGAAIAKTITNPLIKRLASTTVGKAVSGKVENVVEGVKDAGKTIARKVGDVGDEIGEEASQRIAALGEELPKLASKAGQIASKAGSWIKQAGSEARQGISDLGRKIAANNAGVGEVGEPPVTQAFRGGGSRAVQVENSGNIQGGSTQPRTREDMENRGRDDPTDGSEGKGDDVDGPSQTDATESKVQDADEEVEGGEGGIEDATEQAGKGLLDAGESGAKSLIKSAVPDILGDVGEGGLDGAIEGGVGAVAAADAWNPIGWVLGLGLAIGSVVEGVNAANDTAAANQQQHLADAVHLPKSPPVNFAGKLVVPVANSLAQ